MTSDVKAPDVTYLSGPDYFEQTEDRRAVMSPQARALAEELGAAIDLRRRLRAARTALKLTQEELGAIVGENQADVSRFERGLANPSLERANRMLTRLREYIVEHAGEIQTNQEPLGEPITTAPIAAKYLLACRDEEDSLTSLKLQKLLYYAQGKAMVLFGRPLFPEPILAWEHGPVVDDVWRAYGRIGAEPIARPADFDWSNVDPAARAVLDACYQEFGQFSAWKLRVMTHDEDPWRKTPRNQEITSDAIRAWFGRDALVR